MNKNTLKFIIVVSIALLSTDVIYHQVGLGMNVSDTNYCQKNLTATAQRVCGKTDLLCQEHKGENEFWDGFCETIPGELNKIK